ncbi:MAG: tRNA epoxyqueuosine(34) reductase QueG [Burkholderiales bacterium]|nr:tRNA epoxyqueuosine(34) reductase QueG [Burkholderiales bacterium]
MQFDTFPVSAEEKIRSWAMELGFSAVGFAGIDLGAAGERLHSWLEAGFHGEMHYMAKHAMLRLAPERLHPGTASVISVAMNYLPEHCADPLEVLEDPEKAYVSRYALGRDYHKVVRGRLAKLAERISAEFSGFDGRAFVDSAPVMEVELAKNASIGWRGKHTLLLNRHAGSFFFLGEIYTNLPLGSGEPVDGHCGSCTKCIDVCPTGAIVAPYLLDARRCISYLTIEHPGSIPVEFRAAIGNRIYGCDDCQIFCPWNRFAKTAHLSDFSVRGGLGSAALVELFRWTESEFESKMQGSAIRRIGYRRWLRNLAVALGNAHGSQPVVSALKERADCEDSLVREHVSWALAQHGG